MSSGALSDAQASMSRLSVEGDAEQGRGAAPPPPPSDLPPSITSAVLRQGLLIRTQFCIT